jgi:hypothetical protein
VVPAAISGGCGEVQALINTDCPSPTVLGVTEIRATVGYKSAAAVGVMAMDGNAIVRANAKTMAVCIAIFCFVFVFLEVFAILSLLSGPCSCFVYLTICQNTCDNNKYLWEKKTHLKVNITQYCNISILSFRSVFR